MIAEGFTFPSVILCFLNFCLVGLVSKLIHRRRHPDWVGGAVDAHELLDPLRSGEQVPRAVLVRWQQLPKEAQLRIYPQLVIACLDYVDGGAEVGAFEAYLPAQLALLSLAFDPAKLGGKLAQRYQISRLRYALRHGEALPVLASPRHRHDGEGQAEEACFLRIAKVELRQVASSELWEALASDRFWREGLSEATYRMTKERQELANTQLDSRGELTLLVDRLRFSSGMREVSFPFATLTEVRHLGDETLALTSSTYPLPFYFSPLEAEALQQLLQELAATPLVNKA